MMENTEAPKPQGVLMVGSVPLSSSTAVFRKLSETLPNRLQAIPDGETGPRTSWIVWQLAKLPPQALLAKLGGDVPASERENFDTDYNYMRKGHDKASDNLPESRPQFTIDDFKPTDYDGVAVESYKEFQKLRQEGVIPANARFQVSMPMPIDVIAAFCKPELQEIVEPFYEQRMAESLDKMTRAIPAHDLVIQWDMPIEVITVEVEKGRYHNSPMKPFWSPVKEGVIDRVNRMCDNLPPDVGVGFHLCYGDLAHKHWFEPLDLKTLVELSNDFADTVGRKRKIEFFHYPVPKDRVDVEYFLPLKDLKEDSGYVYLGLVHGNDESGTRERIRAAQQAYSHRFGVATECGLGRTPPDEFESIFAISAAVTDPWP